VYARHVGAVEIPVEEGLTGWVARNNRPAFIREDAFADPRMKYVPELEEERFQSMVAVPVPARSGGVIGVVVLHTVAPREFDEGTLSFLVHTASLVAGAIENARLFDEARQRVAELEHLTEVAEVIAAAETLDELGAHVVERSRELLAASGVCLYLLDRDDDRLALRYRSPETLDAPATMGLSELGPELGRSARSARVAVSLVADGELLGALIARGTRELDLARAVASQTAVAIKKIQVLERLTEKNLIRDFFDDLIAGRTGDALAVKLERLGADLSRPHVVVAADGVDDAFERSLRSLARGVLVDRRDHALRALVPVSERAPQVLADLRRLHEASGSPATVGVSAEQTGEEALAHGFEEARHALVGASVMGRTGGVVSYEELGAYKYLLRIAPDPGAHDATIAAVAKLARYDRARNASLLVTLEEYLRRRGNISATSEALYVHPNTLRQRLRRIADLTGLDLRRDDWLMIEIAVKLVRLEGALATVPPGT
jgi:GAF domain-containing protein